MSSSSPAPDSQGPVVLARRPRATAEVTAAAVDLDDLNSPHTMAVLSVPPGATVLDVGCGPGIVDRALAARGCRVWGVEVDSRKAAVARPYCVDVVEADLETMSVPAALAGQSFDVIMCLDVLEHLRDPVSVLTELATLLAPGGMVLLSVPNVTHGALRLELLKGRFRYRNSGLLDRGHLRFFDATALAELIQRSGLRPDTTLRVIKRLDQTEFDVDLETVPEALRAELEADEDALTYQFFVIARPVAAGGVTADAPSLPERLRARADQLAAELHRAGSYARHVEAELKAKEEQLRHVASDGARLEQLSEKLEKAGGYARSLETELATKTAALDGRTAELAHATAEIDRAGGYARHLEAEIAGGRLQVAELEAALADTRRRAEAWSSQVSQLEQNGAALQRLLDDAASYVRHLEQELQRRVGEIAIRDDQLCVLRAHIARAERVIAERDAQLQAQQADYEQALQRDTAARDAALAATERALEDERSRAAHTRELVEQYRRRLATTGADAIAGSAPRIYQALRPLVGMSLRLLGAPDRGRS